MNCETCSSPFKLFEKTKNCLNCDKYVNFEQTTCINSIPTGYYLMDKTKGIIDKCYGLCKTCSGKDYKIGNELHMNCDSCLFKNNSKIKIEGNCPEIEEDDEETPTKSGNSLVIIISVVLSIVVVVVIAVVIYCKCCKNRQFKNDLSSYQNSDGKNIPFEDDLGIN